MLATTPNDSSEGSWSDREMIDGGRKLTGIAIKESSYGNYIAEIRARWGSMCILFLPGTTTSGAPGARQAGKMPTTVKLWNSPPMKRSPPSPASPTTAMAGLAPCKRKPQQAGVGDRMETTHLMVATAFDLRLMHRAMVWDSTTSLGIRLWTNTSSGGCFNTIIWKPEWLFAFALLSTWLMIVCIYCCYGFPL